MKVCLLRHQAKSKDTSRMECPAHLRPLCPAWISIERAETKGSGGSSPSEWTRCVLDPKYANPKGSQWPATWLSEKKKKSERSLSYSLSVIFNWKAAWMHTYQWKMKLIGNDEKEATGSIMSCVQVDVIRKQKLRAARTVWWRVSHL